MKKRTIIIGDIHGCLDEFKSLLEKADYTQGKDRLILVGDLISKGPYPFETLNLAKKINAEVIMGNHELGFLHYLEGKRAPYPGFEPLKQQMGSEVKRWQQWLKTFPFYIETPDFIAVHAGLEPSKHPSNTDVSILTSIRDWNQDKAWFDFYHDKKLVVFGHWAKRGLLIRDNVIGLDSGCVYGKALSALILPERKIVQVKAKQVYQTIEGRQSRFG